MRLIDADALSADVCTHDCSGCRSCYKTLECKDIKELISAAPAIEMVDVVRCQDCKYFDFVKPNIDKPWGVCEYHNRRFAHEADDYCKNGERKQ